MSGLIQIEGTGDLGEGPLEVPAGLERVGGAIRVAQDDFTPQRLAAEIAVLLAAPDKLAAMAAAARSVGRLYAAEALADLVLKVARIAANK